VTSDDTTITINLLPLLSAIKHFG